MERCLFDLSVGYLCGCLVGCLVGWLNGRLDAPESSRQMMTTTYISESDGLHSRVFPAGGDSDGLRSCVCMADVDDDGLRF